METKRLHQFCVIIETGSLVKASELLHLTHSALSKSMKLLQDEVCLVLFRPSGRGLAPTSDGLLFYQRAKEFLEYENHLLMFSKDKSYKPIKIGSVEIFLHSMIGRLKDYSLDDASVSFLDIDPAILSDLVAKRELDYAITYVPYPLSSIDIIEVGQYRLGCYYLKGAFKSNNLSDIPFAVPSQGSLTTNPLGIKERDGWIDSVYPRDKKYTVNLLSTAIELTLQGLCAVYIPDFVAKKINATRRASDALVEFPLPKKQKIQHSAYLLKHKDLDEDLFYQKIYNLIATTISV